MRGVLYLNNKSNFTNYITSFGKTAKDSILKKVDDLWIFGLNKIRYFNFLKASPEYADIKSSKAAFINLNILFKKLNFHSHITDDVLKNRGWTMVKIKEVIKTPYKKGKSIDNLDGKVGDLGESATVYFYKNNQYFVINNKTKQIIQVSNLNNPNWIVDTRIYNIK